MDLFESIAERLCAAPIVAEWPDLREQFVHEKRKRNPHLHLPRLACEAVGGAAALAEPAAAAIAAMYVSVMLVDDMLDRDPRGVYHALGEATTANLALAAQAVGAEVLLAIPYLSPEARIAACRRFGDAALVIARGQQLDSENPADEATYWRVVATKSTPLFSTALYLGALCGGASLAVADEVHALGILYGEIIQIQDDLMDAMATPANPDWTTGRMTLPILFAETVDHPEQQEFRALRERLQRDPEDAAALTAAQEILIRSGAVSYAFFELIRRNRQAAAALDRLPVPHRQGLATLLGELQEPVLRVFGAIGLVPEEAVAQIHAAAWGEARLSA